MTLSSRLPVRIRKEIRGLLPAWLACLATTAVAAGLGGRMRAVGLIGYFLGAVTLGALSIGHEYNCRTLTMLLSQPTRRERLIFEKSGVLALMLLVLCGVAWFGLFDPDVRWGLGVRWTSNVWAAALGLPLLCSLFVAPWLTMVCRNALAGAVFALAIPATVWMASDFTSVLTYGGELAATIEARELAVEIFWRSMVIVCVMAAVASWRMFMRLEAIDSRGLEVGLPTALPGLPGRAGPVASAPAVARRHAMWLLAKKELRLQQLTFAVSGLYLIGVVSLLLFRPMAPASRTTLLFMLTVFHLGAIPLLAGSLASAEERQLGTLEWQGLLPMAGWKQWVIKAAVALGIAVVLTLGLPALVLNFNLYFNGLPEMRTLELGPLTSPAISLAVIPVVVTGLYVSSVCANGLRALLISVPAVFVMIGFTSAYYFRWYWGLSTWWERWSWIYSRPETLGAVGILYMALSDVLAIVIYVGALGMLLRYAMSNHHSAERGTGRVWKQMITLAVFLAISTSLWGGASRLAYAVVNERIEARQITVTGVAVDGGNNLVKDYTVVIFPEAPEAPDQGNRRSYFVPANSQGEFTIRGLPPGGYVLVAVETNLGKAVQRDLELLDRLKPLAMPITLAPGDSKALTLTLSEL